MSRKHTYTSSRHTSAKESPRSRLRLPVFLLIASLVLAGAGFLLVNAFSPKTPTATVGVIDLRADMSGFDKKEVRVKVGEPVTIRLTSLDNSHHTDGGGKHQWAVDDFRASVVAPPEGSDTVTFTPDKPGEFTYYCDICCGGRANPTMQGRLVVEA
jgi:cytochrome c oxidase subunit II